MQLVDGKVHSTNMLAFGTERRSRALAGGNSQVGTARRQAERGLISRLNRSSASERMLALMVAALIVAASPALLSTVRSAVSLAFQILLQAGHFGLVAFQIFGR